MLRNTYIDERETKDCELLNEVLSLNAQELGVRRPVVRALAFLNEVLSLNAQELVVLTVLALVGEILNEVLSLNAQEWLIACSLGRR